MPDRAERSRSAPARCCAEGERVALLGYGYGVQVGARRGRAARRARPQPTVADARFAKPLDGELVEKLAAEHELRGHDRGERARRRLRLGVLEHLEDASPAAAERARVMRIGLPDRYVTHGKPALLREEVGLTGEAVAERVLAALGTRETIFR